MDRADGSGSGIGNINQKLRVIRNGRITDQGNGDRIHYCLYDVLPFMKHLYI